MLDRAKKEINKLKEGSTIVIALSGGPDSMALLNLLKNKKFKIIIAHVNHKIRKESDGEAKYLKEYSKENNIPFEYMEINNYQGNIESYGRKQRYKFFEKIIQKYQANYLVTAHHGDDQIETMLMRIVRGSSIKGYAGIEEVIDKKTYKIVRPLLYNTKDEILEYLEKNHIKYFVDKTNFDDHITRNRYRKYILPLLKKENKDVHLKFDKLSKLLLDIDNLLTNESIKYIDYLNNLKEFTKLDKLIQRRILEIKLKEIYQENITKINDHHLTNILDLICHNKNGTIYLPDNIIGVKDYNRFYLTKNEKIKPYKIKLSKVTKLPNNHQIKEIKEVSSNSNYICRLNKKDVKLPLYVRTRKKGDKMQIKNMNGTKKINDIFINEKISKLERDNYPILVDSNDTILWLPGLKKSKFDKQISENYDIILEYS